MQSNLSNLIFRFYSFQFGHTPEYYRRNQSEFSHNMLLKQFGEDINEEELLADKGKYSIII